MNSTKRQARVAGSLYLLTSIPGFFSLLYIPSHFIVSGDAAATASNIASSEFVFRLGIISELIGFVGFIFVVRALYYLLVGVDKVHASLMLTLMLVSIPVSLLNVLNETAALKLIHGGAFLSVFDKPQLHALAMLFLRLHFDGFMVAQIFWGLWLIPFGILVYKSGFLPRIFGVLLIIACFGYLANSLVGFGVAPNDAITRVVGQLTICELPIILWLLIMGAKISRYPPQLENGGTMTYSPTLLVHIWAGIFALPSGTAAMVFRKGSVRHILAGRVFVASMLTMAVAAVYLAIVKHQSSNIGAGFLTFYLIGTAWLTARRKDGETSRLDWVALLIPLALGILTWMNGFRVVRSGASSPDGVPVGMMFFMGSIMLLAATGDVRMLMRGGVLGARRIARHLWRMCFGLFIAAGSFFLGGANRPLRLLSAAGLAGVGQHLPQALFSTGLYLFLSLLPLVLLIFWLLRVRFTNGYRTKPMAAGSALIR